MPAGSAAATSAGVRLPDPAPYAAAYARDGWVRVEPFLPAPDAELLRRHLAERADWRLVLNQGDKLFELDRAQQAALGPEGMRKLDEAVAAQARHGFQFRYESIRVADPPAARDATPLGRFAEHMSAPATLAFLGAVTGAPDIALADAQATAYGPSHFLTAHDDDVAGKHRRAAYVLNLSPDWPVDWGGLLLLHGPAGTAHALAPRHNALNLFQVPRPHSVSLVAPWAARRRYAVTGWLRAAAPG